jgi:hypothetical protein
MAEKIGLEVETGGSQKNLDKVRDSVINVRKELAEAKKAALNGDGAAAKRVAELSDKMDDLADATKTLKGSGVEQAQSSFALLGDGFKNLDLDKVKTGFSGLGNAMKAIPLFLIVEGISYLIENFDELSKGSGPLAKTLRAVGDALIAKQIEAFVRAGGELDDEKKKQLTASLEAIRGAKVSERIIEETDHKAKQEAYKKHLEELNAIKKGNEDRFNSLVEKLKADEKARDAISLAEEEKAEQDLLNTRKQSLIDLATLKYKQDQQDNADLIANVEKAKKAELDKVNYKKQINDASTNALKGLSDAFFVYQLAKAKGNAAEELKLKRQQFNVDKAFSIQRAVMDGVRSVQAALTIPPPFGQILAAANGILAAANVAKIAATQFDGGGAAAGGGGGAVSLPSSGASVPTISAPQQNNTGTGTTKLDSEGNNMSYSIKTHVVESELTSVQDKIKRLKNQAEF